MKLSATLIFSALAAFASAQGSSVIFDDETGTFKCPTANGIYCSGDSLGTDIIIRCRDFVGQPGRCGNNLVGRPPIGNNPSRCYASAVQDGVAACEKNCIVYGSSGNTGADFSLPGCEPYFEDSATVSIQPSTSASASSQSPSTITPTQPSASTSASNPSSSSGGDTVSSITATFSPTFGASIDVEGPSSTASASNPILTITYPPYGGGVSTLPTTTATYIANGTTSYSYNTEITYTDPYPTLTISQPDLTVTYTIPENTLTYVQPDATITYTAPDNSVPATYTQSQATVTVTDLGYIATYTQPATTIIYTQAPESTITAIPTLLTTTCTTDSSGCNCRGECFEATFVNTCTRDGAGGCNCRGGCIDATTITGPSAGPTGGGSGGNGGGDNGYTSGPGNGTYTAPNPTTAPTSVPTGPSVSSPAPGYTGAAVANAAGLGLAAFAFAVALLF